MQKQSRLRTVVFLICIVAVIGGVVALSGAEPGAFSARGSGPHGLKAMALLYRELGYSVKPWEAPFDALGAQEAVSAPALLVVTQPHAGLSPGDVAALAEWIGRGNTALLLGVPALPHTTAAIAERFGFRFEPVDRRGSGSDETAEVVPVAGSALGRGVRTLSLSGGGRVRLVPTGRLSAAEEFAGPEGAVVLRVAIGRGELVAVSDAMLPTNRGIAGGGNAVLLRNVARRSGAQQIWIAEPRQAQLAERLPKQGEKSPLPPVGPLHVAVAIGAALWAIGRRLGPPLPPDHGELPPSISDYVTGVANLYRRGGARGHALGIQYQALLRAIARRYGLSPASSPEEELALAARLASRRKVPEKPLTRLFGRCRAVIDGEAISERELVKLSKEITRCHRLLFKEE